MQVRKRTINGIFLARAAESAREPAYRRRDGSRWEPVYWHQSVAAAREIALGLEADAGIGRGDRVAILSRCRPEWVAADHAILSLGAVTVGLYDTMSEEQLAYVLRDSGARALFVEGRELLSRVARIAGETPDLARVYAFDDVDAQGPLPAVPLAALRARGESRHLQAPERWETLALSVEPQDLATLVYTSGTTGRPKGAMLTHGNLFYAVEAMARVLPLPKGSRSICYLPLAHVLQRYAVYVGEYFGVEGCFIHDVQRLGEAIRDARPVQLAAVPRVLEKIQDRILETASQLPPPRAAIFRWALSVGSQVAERRRQGRIVLPHLELQHRLADRLVLRRIREQLGGALELIVSGGAPLSPRISEFFHAFGILAVEGYGLTETSAPVATNTPSAFRFGTVGRPLPGTEIRIAEDGEILVRGPGVFQGYWNDPDGTREAFTGDGFFRTGDLGEMTEDGFLRITGRKKELIVTAGGKNVAPTLVEEVLRRGRLVGQAVVLGDRRPFLAALIAPDPEALAAFARERGLDGPSEALTEHPEVIGEIRREIADANARLAHHETVRRFAVLPRELTIEAGELTPSLKVRRRVVEDRHRELIEGLFDTTRGYDAS